MKVRLRAVSTPGEDRRHGPDGPRPTSERGRRRPRNGSDNPVIVPEELTAGVIAWGVRPARRQRSWTPPRRRATSWLSAEPTYHRFAADESPQTGRDHDEIRGKWGGGGHPPTSRGAADTHHRVSGRPACRGGSGRSRPAGRWGRSRPWAGRLPAPRGNRGSSWPVPPDRPPCRRPRPDRKSTR